MGHQVAQSTEGSRRLVRDGTHGRQAAGLEGLLGLGYGLLAGLFQLVDGKHLGADLDEGRYRLRSLFLHAEEQVTLGEGQGLGDVAHFEPEDLADDLAHFGQPFHLGGGLIVEGLAELGWRAQALGGGGEISAVGALADLFQTLLGPGVEAAVGDLLGQLGLHVVELLFAASFQLDEMDAVDGAHRLAELAGLQGRGGLGKGLLHLGEPEPTQVAPVALGAGIFAQLFGGLGEVLALQEALPQQQGLGGGLLELGLALGLEEDVAGLHLQVVALAGVVGRLEGSLVHLDVLAQGGPVHGDELDHAPGRLQEAIAPGLVEGLEGGVPGIGHGTCHHRQRGLLEADLFVAQAVLQGKPAFVHGHAEGRLLDQLGAQQLTTQGPLLHGRVEAGLLEDQLEFGVGLEVSLGVQQHRVLAQEGAQAEADLLVGHHHVMPLGQLLHELLVHEVAEGLGLDEGLEGLGAGLLPVPLVELLHVFCQVAHQDFAAVDASDHGVGRVHPARRGQVGHQAQEDDDHDCGHGRAVGFEDLTEGTKHAELQGTDHPDYQGMGLGLHWIAGEVE